MKHLTVIAILSVVVASCGSSEPAAPSTTAFQTTAPLETTAPVQTTAPTESVAPPETTSQPSATTVEAAGDLLPDLTDQYGCGFGFYVGSADQRAGLFVMYQDVDGAFAGDVETTSEIPGGFWVAEVRVGKDLFSNWCDDVVEPGEPEPDVVEQWVVETGTVKVGDLPGEAGCGPVSGELTGFVAVTADGRRVSFPDMEVTNGAWGCFAG